jgi:hypothetical protein
MVEIHESDQWPTGGAGQLVSPPRPSSIVLARQRLPVHFPSATSIVPARKWQESW